MSGDIALVPARGGSKRIKNKNIVDFFGRPIIAYSLDAMRGSGVTAARSARPKALKSVSA